MTHLASISLLLITVSHTLALSELGCFHSSQLQGLTSQGTYLYQSSGYCEGVCSDSFIIALTGGNECYCGNVMPSGSSDGSCSDECTGYPDEMCGGDSDYTVYANYANEANEKSWSSSSEASSSTESSASSESSEASSSTESSDSSSSDSSTSSDSSSTDSSSTTSKTSSKLSSKTTSKSSSTSVVVVSTSKTSTAVVTVTQSASGSESSASDSSDSSDSSSTATTTSSSSSKSATSHKLSGGAIAGIVIGSLVGLAALIALVLFFCFRRRDDDDDDESYNSQYDDKEYPAHLDNTATAFSPPSIGARRFSDGSLSDSAVSPKRQLRVINPDLAATQTEASALRFH